MVGSTLFTDRARYSSAPNRGKSYTSTGFPPSVPDQIFRAFAALTIYPPAGWAVSEANRID